MRPYHGDVCDNYESLPLHTNTRAYVHVLVCVRVFVFVCASLDCEINFNNFCCFFNNALNATEALQGV